MELTAKGFHLDQPLFGCIGPVEEELYSLGCQQGLVPNGNVTQKKYQINKSNIRKNTIIVLFRTEKRPNFISRWAIIDRKQDSFKIYETILSMKKG